MNDSWRGLDFGVKKAQVVKFLKDRIISGYQATIEDIMDVRERDELTRKMRAQVNVVGKDFVSFDGRRSGWGVSVIRNEFSHGNHEEMLDVRKGKDHIYLFFVKGVYYKMIHAGVGRSMSDLFDELTGVYGKPDRIEYLDPRSKEGIRSARWDEGLLTLFVEDKTHMFQCITIRWAMKDADDTKRERRRKTSSPDDDINPLVREAAEPPAKRAKDPVDEILGR